MTLCKQVESKESYIFLTNVQDRPSNKSTNFYFTIKPNHGGYYVKMLFFSGVLLFFPSVVN